MSRIGHLEFPKLGSFPFTQIPGLEDLGEEDFNVGGPFGDEFFRSGEGEPRDTEGKRLFLFAQQVRKALQWQVQEANQVLEVLERVVEKNRQNIEKNLQDIATEKARKQVLGVTRGFYCYGGTSSPPAWTDGTNYLLVGTLASGAKIDAPYTGTLKAIEASVEYSGGHGAGGGQVRIYNDTTASADGTPTTGVLADDQSDSATGGTLAITAGDKLVLQVLWENGGQGINAYANVSLFYELTADAN